MLHDSGQRAGRLERLRRAFADADAVIFGHSHLPLHERAPDGFQIFNPGSPTERRRAPRHTMGDRHAQTPGELTFELVAARLTHSPTMDLSIFFAGTAGSAPTARRGLPALLVRRGGDRILFDCGEGTQRQLVSSVGLTELTEIFLTHFHADHWLGPAGDAQDLRPPGRERPLTIHGPPGCRR